MVIGNEVRQKSSSGKTDQEELSIKDSILSYGEISG